MTFDEYITENYDELTEIARSIFNDTSLEPTEIVSEMYLSVRKKALNGTENDYKYYCIAWLKNSSVWTGGNKVRKLKIHDHIDYEAKQRYLNNLTADQDSHNQTVADLIRAGFDTKQAKQIEICILASKRLPLFQRRLFELHYIEGYSLQDIADSCNLPKVTIFRDVKRMRMEVEKLIQND